jgi:erythronate-4-phosphate dehydrogenase
MQHTGRSNVNMKITADENIPFVKECFGKLGQVHTAPGSDINSSMAKDTDILVVRSVTKVNEQLLKNTSVKFVGTCTIGFDHIDRDYLDKNNIGFASAPASNADSVAEYIISALLNIAQKKKITLEGKKIGVIGVGNVGSRVVKNTQALGMKPILNDPPLKRQTNNQKYRPLEELYDCDFITVHTPLTHQGRDRTYHLVNEKFLNNLKSGLVLLNTSRGAVVDSAALQNAVENGKLSAVCLDVWENEPDINTDLLKRVDIATPHIAGYSFDGKVRGMVMIFNAVCKYFDIQTRADQSQFLPEPENKHLKVDNTENLLSKIVNKIYNVYSDDKKMRKILEINAKKRPEFFKKLRKEYPVRREFHNFIVEIEKTNKQQAQLKQAFENLGFDTSIQSG